MKTIASVGSIVVDLSVATPRVPITGENLRAHSFQLGPGGKGANAAVALARLGAHSLLVGCIGDDDFGRMELAAIEQYGVDSSAVLRIDAPTGMAVIMVNDDHENTILAALGANEQITAQHIEQALASRLSSLDMLLVDFEIPEEAVAAAVRLGKRHNIPVLVDAGPPRQFAPETWRDATYISPNAAEASELVGYPVETEEAAQSAARDLLEQGPQAVILKRGKAGALLVTEDETLLIPGFKVQTVDTTGAGDAFTAMLAVCISEGRPLHEAVRWSNAAGALAVQRFGTMGAMPSRDEVEAFLAATP